MVWTVDIRWTLYIFVTICSLALLRLLSLSLSLSLCLYKFSMKTVSKLVLQSKVTIVDYNIR